MSLAVAFFACISLLCLLVGIARARARLSASGQAAFVSAASLLTLGLSLWLLFTEPSLSGRQMPDILIWVYSLALAFLVFGLAFISVTVCRQASVAFLEGSRLAAVAVIFVSLALPTLVWLIFFYITLRYAGCYDGKGC